MGKTAKRLATAVSLMELLELRRNAAADPNLGSNIERQLVDRELCELEADIVNDPGPLARFIGAPMIDPRQEARN